ncbi:MAG: YigZ family protein [Planctomycetes bacterium]|nr:YigZ family protein [Planctomycetota bacterium]
MSAPSPADSYRTVAAPFEHEPDKTKGSRHIANVFPVHDAAEIAAALQSVEARMPDATHHAYAWRLGRGEHDFRYSDDGEPSGSAGRPILQQIDGRDLTDVLVVVSRYFGGTKLGTGGLVRAYGGAAAEALDRAEIVEVVPQARLHVEHGYEDSGAIAGVLHAFHVTPEHADYGAAVAFDLTIAETEAEGLVAALRDATAGRARIERTPSDRAR